MPRKKKQPASLRDLLAKARGGRRKYRAVPTRVGNITFASKLEAAAYAHLLGRQSRGEIAGLETQVEFPLVVNGVKVCAYVADFRWREADDGRVVVGDAKGVPTPAYRIKRRLMLACHGIDIFEMKRGKSWSPPCTRPPSP